MFRKLALSAAMVTGLAGCLVAQQNFVLSDTKGPVPVQQVNGPGLDARLSREGVNPQPSSIDGTPLSYSFAWQEQGNGQLQQYF